MVISIWLWPIPIPWRFLRDTVQKPWRFGIKMRWTEGQSTHPKATFHEHMFICSVIWIVPPKKLSIYVRIKVWRSLQVELFPIISMSLVPVGIMQAQMRAEKKNLRPVLFGVAHVLQLLGCPNFIQTSQKAVESRGVVESCWIGQDGCAARRSGRTDDEICFQNTKP
jgi:hypothetical protein